MSTLLKSFPDKFRLEVGVEGIAVHVADGQVGVGIHDYAVFVHLLYLLQIDDVRAVNAHEGAALPSFSCSAAR